MTIEVKDIIQVIVVIGIILGVWLNVRKLKSDINVTKLENDKKIEKDTERRITIDNALVKAQKDIDMAHSEIRNLKEQNGRIEFAINSINFEIKTLLTGFNDVKIMLTKNLEDNNNRFTEIHNRLDKHIEGHING